MTTLEKIRTEIANEKGTFPKEHYIRIIDKYAEQEPKVTTTSTDEPMVMQYPQVDGITPTVVKAEQGPCDDTVSRILKRMWNCRGKHTTSIDKVKMEQIIREELLSVTQKHIECDDAISRQSAILFASIATMSIDETVKAIKRLPSVRPQEQKTGKWICIDDYHIGKFKCSVCQTEGFPNTVMYEPTWNYCPNCGAKMVEPQESESDA